MNTTLSVLPGCDQTEADGAQIFVLYDDRAAGLRAKEFADRLVGACAGVRRAPDFLWRTELLDFPPIAEEAARQAAESNFILVSFARGSRMTLAIRRWLDQILANGAARGTVLIALFDPSEADWHALEASRHCCRSLASGNGVPFFSCVSLPPAEAPRLSSLNRSRRSLLSGKRRRPTARAHELSHD